jgi:hypothetical protein
MDTRILGKTGLALAWASPSAERKPILKQEIHFFFVPILTTASEPTFYLQKAKIPYGVSQGTRASVLNDEKLP